MKRFVHIIAAVFLALWAQGARAIDLQVSITSTINLPQSGGVPTPVSLQFTLPQDVTGAVPQGEAFALFDLPVEGDFNGAPATFTDTQLGWFNYASSFYYGLDVRLRNVFVANDMLQFIVTAPSSLYSGSDAAPRLEAISLDNLGGGAFYYATGSGNTTAESYFSDASYRAAAVPEPATALLLPLGLAWMTLRRRRQARTA